MSYFAGKIVKLKALREDTRFQNEARRAVRSGRELLAAIFRLVLIVGISYVILGPMIGIVASSFFSNSDKLSPVVYLIPQNPTLQRYIRAYQLLDYWKVLGSMLVYVVTLTLIQIAVCSLVGYGFARFQFPLKKFLFACVIIVIVIPLHSIMLPLYMTFRQFDPLGLMTLFAGGPINLMTRTAPMYIMTIFGCGLRSGLYIYIFNQFFRGLPKEIEEAAFVDGAGTFYTFLRVMIPNAMPSIITVAIFSLVWQYNDIFYANLFNISNNVIISKKLNTLNLSLAGPPDQILDPGIRALYVYAGIILMILPMILIYVILQKRFIEGVERSGIVG
ncbi:MAG: carbohydrate ABC transporter permease [Oscillospiraceae bacterium]|jgi:multiple sugar transport system permease protein|nr:carbohydrate ABC transporter permease [Oscillospiraceae bacterium]